VSRRKSATSWSSGLEEIREGCRHCDYTTRSIRVVPRLDTNDSSFWSSSSLSNGLVGHWHVGKRAVRTA